MGTSKDCLNPHDSNWQQAAAKDSSHHSCNNKLFTWLDSDVEHI